MAIDQKTSLLAQAAYQELCNHPVLGKYIDTSLTIPAAYAGEAQIRLVILGQDPTVKNKSARRSITTVLNLDKAGSLTHYLAKVCALLGVDLKSEVYATNLYKNFFIEAPTQIKTINLFAECLPFWLPVLQAELDELPGVPVLTLGEPLLSTLVNKGVSGKVRDYWGYTSGWKSGREKPFKILFPEQNILHRTVFPYPHQPSWQRKVFYSDHLERYTAYIRNYMQNGKKT